MVCLIEYTHMDIEYTHLYPVFLCDQWEDTSVSSFTQYLDALIINLKITYSAFTLP